MDNILTYPPVREHPDEVLRGQGFKHRHKELDHMFISSKLALEQEVLVVQDGLTVHVLHQDPEGFRVGVELLLPLEVWALGERRYNFLLKNIIGNIVAVSLKNDS